MSITGTENPNSPQLSRVSVSNLVWRRHLTYDRGYDWEAEMPTLGALDATYGRFRGYTSSPRGPYIKVTLTYDTLELPDPDDGDEEFFASSTTREKPIELHPDYRTKWIHGVYYPNNGKVLSIAADFPGGQAAYDAATDLSDLDGSKLRWSKSNLGVDWIKLVDPLYPGETHYLDASRLVTRRTWHRTQSAAEADLAAIGTLVLPDEDFGASPSLAANWLVIDSSVDHDGRFWVATSQYLHSAADWNSDIYS